MKIVIYLFDNSKIELFDCSEEDAKRLTSQFNNGHLMHAKNVYINPYQVVSFFTYESEATK
ncbi:hypothetical protein QM799_08700 [Streptococcus infantis]|uniref:hypothetical protein n=1 Tax=Streptococcus infantis TaxID=68892 RepID=UPI0020543940|nr:MAG TPA: hypothetical protein [Caudoviricetes sp.]